MPLCLRVAAALMLAVAIGCKSSDNLAVVHAVGELPDTVDLGRGYAGDMLSGSVVVGSIGSGPLRILDVQAEQPDVVTDWAGEPIRVLPEQTAEIGIQWSPASASALDATVTVVTDAEESPVRDVHVLGNALAIPLCNDRQCQIGVFKRASEQCEYTNREGRCEDNNACTINDHCAGGECTGDPRNCDDNRACTRNTCDAQTGCVFPTDPDVCVDDGNPCTAHLCNDQGECETTVVPDWTGCASATCMAIYACLEGVCTSWPITLNPDACHQGDVDFGTAYAGQTVRASFSVEAATEPLTLTRVYTNHPDLWVNDYAGTVLAVGESLEIPVEWRPTQEGTLQGEVVVETTGCESWVVAARGISSPIPICDDGNPCTTEWFDTTRGMCTWVPHYHAGCLGPRVVAGYAHACALLDNGSVRCWGRDWYGALGNDSEYVNQDIPVDVAGPFSRPTVAITAGSDHTCALLDTGDVKCWGLDSLGQVGIGGTGFPRPNQATPVDVVGLSGRVVAIAAGEHHTCALLDTGGIECWGDNRYGQTGDGDPYYRRTTPVRVVGLSSGVVEVAPGGRHTCALLDTGGVMCWGDNSYGQLGNGSTNDFESIPTAVTGLLSGVVTVSAGYVHTCAVLDSGGAMCWGEDRFGQLGDGGANTDQIIPVEVTGIPNHVVAVSAGSLHTCALLDTGSLMCWGDNNCHQLGNEGDDYSFESAPAGVVGLSSGVLAVAAGGNHTCAWLDTGSLKCWGCNSYGEIGHGDTGSSYPHPVDVVGIP